MTTSAWNISHSRKKSARHCHKCTQVCTYSIRYSCQIFTQLEFSRQIFEKQSNIELHENSSSGSRGVPCGRTDRHDAANSYFSQFYERDV